MNHIAEKSPGVGTGVGVSGHTQGKHAPSSVLTLVKARGRASFCEADGIGESKRTCQTTRMPLVLLLMIRQGCIVLDSPFNIWLLELVISLSFFFLHTSSVVKHSRNFCPARVGIDLGSWRRPPKAKHTSLHYDLHPNCLADVKRRCKWFKRPADRGAMRSKQLPGLWSGQHLLPKRSGDPARSQLTAPIWPFTNSSSLRGSCLQADQMTTVEPAFWDTCKAQGRGRSSTATAQLPPPHVMGKLHEARRNPRSFYRNPTLVWTDFFF